MTISEQQKKDIEEEKRKSFSTKRTSVDSIEEKLFTINPNWLDNNVGMMTVNGVEDLWS